MIELLTKHNVLEALFEHATLTDQDGKINCRTKGVRKVDAGSKEYTNLPIFQRHATSDIQLAKWETEPCVEWKSLQGCAQAEGKKGAFGKTRLFTRRWHNLLGDHSRGNRPEAIQYHGLCNRV